MAPPIRCAVIGEVSSAPDGHERRSPAETYANVRALQDQQTKLWEDMAFRYPALTATEQAPALTAREARSLSTEQGATLVEYYQHAGGWCAFVVTPDGVRHVPLPGVDDELLEMFVEWLDCIESPIGRGSLSYNPLRRLHEALITPLRSYLPPESGAVVLAPFAWLHLLPLGAALDPEDPDTNRYAFKDYRLAFAPSLAALRVARDQSLRGASSTGQTSSERVLSVAYPGRPGSEHYLENAEPEARAISGHFEQVTGIYQDAATPDAVLAYARGQDVIHFSCHGLFDPEAPEQSGLMLSGGWLTVQRIITELRLDRTRLATVSACLSGRAELRRGEEHVGLLQAMMSGGARTVVASLWSVDDASTRILFETFYKGRAAGISPADALAEAARLVRDRGWEHPYYWAAFQVSGLAYEANGPISAQRPAGMEKRIGEMNQESKQKRGGSVVDAEKKMVKESLILLKQMSWDPEKVRETLDRAEQREKVVEELSILADRASEVQTEAQLLDLADAIHRLIEDTPALVDLLDLLPPPKGIDVKAERKRTISAARREDAFRRSQEARERAADIQNYTVILKQKLELPAAQVVLKGKNGDGR